MIESGGGRVDRIEGGESGSPDPALPRHVAIIMDGNRRWARQHGQGAIMGHRAGVESVRASVRTCRELGIGVLTLYAFSTENWKRPPLEVNGLWQLVLEVLRHDLPELMAQGVRVRVIGMRERLPMAVREAVRKAESMTAANDRMVLVLALNYGARQEIVQAVRSIGRMVQQGRLDPEAIDEAAFSSALSTVGIPDPDLVIRTSGELRVSNFLLWQIAYSEFFVTSTPWPEFGREEFLRAMDAYRARERRFGGSGEAR